VAQPAPQPFDVMFLDPPYEVPGATVTGVLLALAEHGWLAPDALLVVERSRRSGDFGWPSAVGEAWTRSYGETVLHFGCYAVAPAADGPGSGSGDRP